MAFLLSLNLRQWDISEKRHIPPLTPISQIGRRKITGFFEKILIIFDICMITQSKPLHFVQYDIIFVRSQAVYVQDDTRKSIKRTPRTAARFYGRRWHMSSVDLL